MSKEAPRSASSDLLQWLRCPLDGSELRLAPSDVIAELNRRIQLGGVINVSGEPVTQGLSGGLIREAGDRLYPIVDQIPVMLPDEAIELGV